MTPAGRRIWRGSAVAALLLFVSGCAGTGPRVSEPADIPHEPRSKYGNPASYVVFGKRYYVMDSAEGYVEQGIASWYGPKFHGRKTSSGETYDMHGMTAAHKTLPLPTWVRVTNLENGRSIVLKVNDRGPFVHNRLIDLSRTAADRLGIIAKGTGLVEVRALSPGPPAAQPIQVRAPAPPAEPVVADGHADVYVQVGAFSNRQNAEQMRGELLLNGFSDVNILPGRDSVFRVRIGPLANVELADRTVSDLERLGLMNYHIVID